MPGEEAESVDAKKVPAGLRRLALRLRAAAALAEAVTQRGGGWLREFAESLEITTAVAVDDYKQVAAHTTQRTHAQGLGY